MKKLLENNDFIKAYDNYADAIFRHCYFRVFDREKAKEIMQEAFTRTWEFISKGNEIENIRAFLYRVANNLIVDNARKKKELSFEILSKQGFDPGFEDKEKLQNIIDGKAAVSMVKKLDIKYRKVILMRFVDGFSPKEIAETLGKTENTVSVRIHRGLKQLRNLIDENNKNYE